ncbi:MAG: Rieske 2Fe-2S domain-containing protein [Devosia sp.]|nr:Rieske 2Fe-2S domain-containing protein [Devosia sp.]
MAIDISSLVDMSRGLVDRRIFADQEIYDMEMERIFRRNWICLGHETEIPNKNDFFTTWIGEDPVIVVRGGDGKIRVLLNLCRHRGGTVCRVDKGSARSFLCPYHGWAYSNDGSLKGVPSLEVGYRNQLDLEEWGLVEVPRVDNYKGLLFATWDRNGPDLRTFLADSTFYLDCLLDRLDGGTEIVVGTRRWVIPCNWKHAAENFIGDSYHAAFTHASIFKVPGLEGAGNRVSGTEGYQIQCGNGHGVGAWVASKEAARGGYGHLEGIDEWMATPEIENEMR